MPAFSSQRKACPGPQPLNPIPTITLPSRLVAVAELRFWSHGTAFAKEPSSCHSVPLSQMAAFSMPLGS